MTPSPPPPGLFQASDAHGRLQDALLVADAAAAGGAVDVPAAAGGQQDVPAAGGSWL